MFRVHLSSLESPGLVHINPYAIVGELIVEVAESLPPHMRRVGVEPVHEYGDVWPHLIDQVVVVLSTLVESRLDEDIISIAHLIVFVAQINSRNASIDDRYDLLFVLM